MALPNFLIVGFPKCGTTSVVNSLKNHSEVFIPKEKELRFFSWEQLKSFGYNGPGDKRTKKLVVKSWSKYQRIYSRSKNHKLLGDATTDTAYYYEYTIPIIKTKLKDPKIIIILRNPINRSISAYSHLVRDGREKLSFKNALNAELKRKQDGYESIWAYSESSLYFDSVSSFINNFTNVKIILFDDIKNNFEKVMEELFGFLDINKESTIANFHTNRTGKPKNKILNSFLNRPLWIKDILKKIIGENYLLKIKDNVQRHNLKKIHISNDDKQIILKKHLKDISRLENLINRDLSQWKSI